MLGSLGPRGEITILWKDGLKWIRKKGRVATANRPEPTPGSKTMLWFQGPRGEIKILLKGGHKWIRKKGRATDNKL